MRRIISVVVLMAVALGAVAQQRKVQNKPYIDLRPLHLFSAGFCHKKIISL